MRAVPILLLALATQPAAAADPTLEARADNGNAVLLFDEAGPCVAGARHAEFHSARGERIPGCWAVDAAGMVRIVFFDADALMVPFAVFKPPKKT